MSETTAPGGAERIATAILLLKYAKETAPEIFPDYDPDFLRFQPTATSQIVCMPKEIYDQQAWDMRSLEITVENLRAEVERLREVLEDARHSLIHADELTLEMLREWLAGQAYISHTRSLQVYDGNLNVHWERYAAFEEIIAIIDDGRLPDD